MSMDFIELNIGGTDLRFQVTTEPDHDHGTPWDESCGHGPVSDWTTRAKRAGELILNQDGNKRRYYDYAEACRIALADGWGAIPWDIPGETARQKAARAARADYDLLKSWCLDSWQYIGVTVTLLDDDDEETEVSDSLWGVEDIEPEHVAETAWRLADELASGYGTRWGEQSRNTFGYLD